MSLYYKQPVARWYCNENNKAFFIREFQEALESDNHTLRDRGQRLEAELRERQQELQEKEAERQRMAAKTAQSMEELRGVASHWSDKWQEVALRLQSTQGELESLKQNNPGDAVRLLRTHLNETRQNTLFTYQVLFVDSGHGTIDISNILRYSCKRRLLN